MSFVNDFVGTVTGGLLGGEGPSQENPEKDALDRISREQYDDYVKRFVPIENELIRSVGNAKADEQSIAEAGRRSDGAFDVSGGILRRRFARLGVTPTQEQRGAIARKTGLARALANVDAQNRTRMGLEDQSLDTAGSMVSLGRNIASSATSGLGAAASTRATENAAAQQRHAADQAGKMQLLGTGASIAMLAL